MPERKSDLIVLVPDLDMEKAVKGIFTRSRSLGISHFEADIQRHPLRDSGCCTDGVSFLAPFVNQYEHALLLFDREGCGREDCTAEELETEIKRKLAETGWDERGGVVILDPELEIWVWSDSPHVDEELGWKEHHPPLRTWLTQRNLLQDQSVKPARPKEAVEAALREVRKPRSPSLYFNLAEKVGFSRCYDRAFIRLKTTLRQWFKEE
jgi:hypothetical protein